MLHMFHWLQLRLQKWIMLSEKPCTGMLHMEIRMSYQELIHLESCTGAALPMKSDVKRKCESKYTGTPVTCKGQDLYIENLRREVCEA